MNKLMLLGGSLLLAAATGCCSMGGKCPLAGGDTKKIIGAKVSIKADQVDAFTTAAKTIVAASRAEPGCISYTLYQSPYDKTAFFFFEEWKSQKAIDEHFAAPHFKAFADQLPALTAGPAEITIYDAPREKKPGS